MNRRILTSILLGAMVLSMLSGCKSEEDSIALDYGLGVQQGQSNENDDASEDPAVDQGAQNSGKPDSSAGKEDQDQNSGSGQSNTPAGDQDADEPSADTSADKNQNKPSSGSNQGSSSEGLKETFDSGKPISVAAGETVWFGPASTAQKEQLTFTDKSGKATKVTIDQLQKVDTFNNGYVIYAYKATAAGSVAVQISESYSDLFLASKDAMDMNAYFNHWDNMKDRNLYVSTLDKTNKQIGTDGKLKASDQGGSTHAISVKQGDTLTIAPVSAGTLVQGCAYDAKMKSVGVFNGYEMKEAFAFPQGMRAYTYTVPAGVSFVRFNVPAEARETFLVIKNKEFDQSYYTRITKVDADEVGDPLFEKECLFVGDSLCSASQDDKVDGLRGWARRVKELSGAISTNCGSGGSAFSTIRLDNPNDHTYQIIYKQLTKSDKKDFDYVLIEGGTNDAWETAPIGVVSEGFEPANFDLSTYAGGLEMAIYTAVKEYGNKAAIGYLMAYQMPRNKKGVVATKMNDYYTMGKEICEKWNISYFDMYNHTEINKKLDPQGTEHVPDGTHADASGYDIIGPYITDYMRSMTPVTQKVRNELAAR